MQSRHDVWRLIKKNLNFYRVHLLFFSFTPLILSAVLYASNGQTKISYIDALFNSVSAMTVCGLATVDLSSMTGWQQVILFIQMSLGSPVAVSWFMVYLRRHYFAKKFEHLVTAAAGKATHSPHIKKPATSWPKRLAVLFRLTTLAADSKSDDSSDGKGPHQDSYAPKRLRVDMIRRMADAPVPVNPSGWISGGIVPATRSSNVSPPENRRLSFAEADPNIRNTQMKSPSPSAPVQSSSKSRRLSDPGERTQPSAGPLHRFETIAAPSQHLHSTQTIEFAPTPARVRQERWPALSAGIRTDARSFRPSMNLTMGDRHTIRSLKNSGFGGFPMPHEILQSLFHLFFPGIRRQITKTVTIPRTTTITSLHGKNIMSGAKPVSYVSFDAVVGRNSTFPLLTNEQLEELGGVEYRALNALLWIVAGYHLSVQIIAYVIVAPYMNIPKWQDNFVPPALHRSVPPPWFSLFQTVSAYTNTGMSLVDTSMVPFRTAYPMIIVLIYLVLAGNTCFPIFLRFWIWILAKLVPERSRASETLHFLLDHPRRCFIYLFPSHQTWFLLTIVITLNLTDWFSFLVLDIGNPEVENIPLGTRVIVGLLQAVAVRAAGFGTISLSALAPAVKVLYVIMMYISVYPIAMSVRSTNVYEEQSLGIFHNGLEDDEDTFEAHGSRVTVWSRYLAMHARKQLAFDMWWLCLALFFVCIIERSDLQNNDNASWLNVFSIVFELVSAYGTVGLSLGIPTANYSLSGALRPLSKLIICLVMIRGRHRGLPVAIDRAILLPGEFERDPEDEYTQPPPSNGRSDILEPEELGDFELRQRKKQPIQGDVIMEESRSKQDGIYTN